MEVCIEKEKGLVTGTAEVVIDVGGMHCKSCSSKINSEMLSIDGVIEVSVSLSKNTCKVVYETKKTNPQQLKEHIENVGFTATIPATLILSDDSPVAAVLTTTMNTENSNETVGTAEVVFDVGGMHCKSCSSKINSEMLSIDGVIEVSVSLSKNTCKVVYETKKTNPQQLKEHIENVGFTATIPATLILSDDSPVTAKANLSLDTACMSNKQHLSSLDKDVHQNYHIDDDIEKGVKLEGLDSASDDTISTRFNVSGMVCSSCVSIVENGLKSKKGIISVQVSLLTNSMVVEHMSSITPSDVISYVEESGYSASICSNVAVLFLSIQGMSCASCSSSIESSLKSVVGITDVSISLMTNSGKVTYDRSKIGPRTIIDDIEKIGYTSSITKSNDNRIIDYSKPYKKRFFLSLWFAIPAAIVTILHLTGADDDFFDSKLINSYTLNGLIGLVLASPVQFYVVQPFYVSAYKSLRHGHANMDVLVALGTTIAYIFSIYSSIYALTTKNIEDSYFFEASIFLVTFVFGGRYLEAKAKAKTSQAISKLMNLQGSSAILVSEELQVDSEIDVALVQFGDILKVPPGKNVPVDGVIVDGETTIDEGVITGESMPLSKKIGDRVIGGTVNLKGMILMKATGVGEDTFISQIIRLVEEAQTKKAPIQAIADKVSGYFVPIIVFLAVIDFSVWMILSSTNTGKVPEWIIERNVSKLYFSLLFGISTLVVACPCALGLATPTAVMVASGVGAKNGILIKGGDSIEMIHKVNAIVFDKTGTLTSGRPTVKDIRMFRDEMEEERFLFLVACAESGSAHPLGLTIVDKAKSAGIKLIQPNDFEAISGMGLVCKVDGNDVVIGNRQMAIKFGLNIGEDEELVINEFEELRRTCVLVWINQSLWGVISIVDQIREEANDALILLRRMGLGIWLLTGDNRKTAEAVALTLGIDYSHVFSEVLPAYKASKVEELQKQGLVVAMVGDGVNDSPALSQADVGIAIGAGTDIAIESADVVLVKSNLFDIATAIDLSKKTFKRIKLNFGWACFYNIIMIPFAAGIFYFLTHPYVIPPMFAGLAMAFSSISVVLSSLHLNLYKPPTYNIPKPTNIPPLHHKNKLI